MFDDFLKLTNKRHQRNHFLRGVIIITSWNKDRATKAKDSVLNNSINSTLKRHLATLDLVHLNAFETIIIDRSM